MVVLFYFLWWSNFRKCKNLPPFKPLAAPRTIGAHIINIRIVILYSTVTIGVNKGMTAFRAIHKLLTSLQTPSTNSASRTSNSGATYSLFSILPIILRSYCLLTFTQSYLYFVLHKNFFTLINTVDSNYPIFVGVFCRFRL